MRLDVFTRCACLALGLLSACSGGDEAAPGGGGNAGAGNASSGGSAGSGGAAAGGSSGGSGASGGSAGMGGSAGALPGASCKRGIAYGNHSKQDLAALQPAVSWWYNWAYTPDKDLRDGSYGSLGVEYVPMIWGGNFDANAVSAAVPDSATALLGFNEPNFGSQANLSAAQAAALWPEVEKVADVRGLTLVSPAVNFCGGTCQETDPFKYLDDFFAACAGCRVDRVAFHVYVGCHPSGANKAQWLIDHVETYKKRFSQPLWLTEFACDDATSFDEQIAFLEDAVSYLENDDRIERYAWFSGRFDGIPFVNLLGNDGELTPLGQAYVSAPAGPDCQH